MTARQDRLRDKATRAAQPWATDARAGRITFMWARGRRGLWSMHTPWLTLTGKAEGRSFFHLYAWYESYLHSLETDSESVYFFLALRDRAPVAIIPLRHTTRTRHGVSWSLWESIVRPHVPFGDVVFARDAEAEGVMDALVTFLRRMAPPWDVIVFRRTPEHADLPRLLFSAAAPWISRPGRPVHVLDLKATYEELYAGFRGNFRKNLRKARKKLEHAGVVEIEQVNETEALQDAFTRFMRVEAAGWKGEAGTRTAIQCNPALVQFYRKLIAGFGAGGGCEVNLLKLNGEDVAAQFCLLIGRTYYILKIGYDERHARLAPGNMLLEALLQRLSGDMYVNRVDLISDARWHDDWNPASYRVTDYLVFNRSPRGRLLFLSLWLKQQLGPVGRRALDAGRGLGRKVRGAGRGLGRAYAACVDGGFRLRRTPRRRP